MVIKEINSEIFDIIIYCNQSNNSKDIINDLTDNEVTEKENCDINLSKTYDEFIENFCKDKNLFFNLIRYKNFLLGKRAFVSEYLKIFLNSLYIHVIYKQRKGS